MVDETGADTRKLKSKRSIEKYTFVIDGEKVHVIVIAIQNELIDIYLKYSYRCRLLEYRIICRNIQEKIDGMRPHRVRKV